MRIAYLQVLGEMFESAIVMEKSLFKHQNSQATWLHSTVLVGPSLGSS
jgi:hypothetical protein